MTSSISLSSTPASSTSPSFIFLRNGGRASGSRSAHFCWLRNLGCFKFLSRFHLSLLGQIFNLSFSKHNVGVGCGVLVHVGLVDHEKDVL